MEINETKTQTDERLPWHKPEVLRLTVNLDTAQKGGSPVDGFGPTGPG